MAKGSKSDPYTMAEYNEMVQNGAWKGGYVKDDNGNVSYTLPELVANGYSGSGSGSGSSSGNGSGSDFQFGSYKSFQGDPGLDDDDEDDEESGGNNGNNNQSSGGNGEYFGGGGGGSHSGSSSNDIKSIFNGDAGTFLYGAPFYTEREMSTMQKNGTWKGGNVYTLGYIGSDLVIDMNIPSLDVDYDSMDACGAKQEILLNIQNYIGQLMPSLYIQAIIRYDSGLGLPMYVDANSLGLEYLNQGMLKQDSIDKNKYCINLFNVDNLRTMLKGRTIAQKAKILSAAFTLGNITLMKIGENTFTIQKDTYDFDMHNWDRSLERNIATIIGFAVSEGISMGIDYTYPLLFGKIAGRGFDVGVGIMRRHVIGSSTFDIYFRGTVTILP